MSNRFEPGNFSCAWVHASGLSGAWSPREEQRERIQDELRPFLSAQEARETATQVYKLALDIDVEIGRILQDPLARRLYDYDGRFFTPRGARGFHTAFSGLHLLESLNDSILQTYFRGREKLFAIRWLMEELGKHAWVAKRRRMNWEHSHTLDLVPKNVLEAIIKRTWERRKELETSPPPLSAEEQAFFQPFEEQMESPR